MRNYWRRRTAEKGRRGGTYSRSSGSGRRRKAFQCQLYLPLVTGPEEIFGGGYTPGVSLASRVRKWSLPSPFRGAWIIASSQFRRIYLPVQLSRPVQVRPLFVAPADRNAAPVGNVEAPARLSS
jgi:hypothetical protein